MSYLDRIQECNQFDWTHFIPFEVKEKRVGLLKHQFARELARWPDVFSVADDGVRFVDRGSTGDHRNLFNERSKVLADINQQLFDSGLIKQVHGELYPVKKAFESPALLLIDRAAAVYYGIRAWGQHLNGYVKKQDGLFMWIAKRSPNKGTFPGKLDNMVAGGLPHGISLVENLAKECAEEASVPAELIQCVKPVGAINYCIETPKGLKPDSLFCYDLELPESFTPVCQDGEVEAFSLMPIQEVADLVRETREFKPNCDLTIIDFLIRHGFIQPDEKDYLNLVNGLRSTLDVPEMAINQRFLSSG